jgi:predicted transcriptional regulator
MEVLWASPKPLKPADVKKTLKGRLAYTTIMTVLSRMAEKKIVRRKLSGKVYLYSPIENKDKYVSACFKDLFDRMYISYGSLFTKAVKRYILHM